MRAIILKGDRLLCVRLKQYPGKLVDAGQDFWCLPGGGVDIGEPLIPALERELIEETGIKPQVDKLLYVQQFQHKDWEFLELFFHVTNSRDYETINLEETTHGAIELAEIGFIDPRMKNVLPVFLTTQDLVTDSANGTTIVFNNLGL